MSNDFTSDGPSLADLAGIEAEWPQIQADIDALADPDEVDRLMDLIEAIEGTTLADRRRRRAARRLINVTLDQVHRHVCRWTQLVEVALTTDCRYGCKVMRCSECGGEQVSHRDVYGCPIGRAAAMKAVA